MAIIVILCGAPHLYKKDMNNSGLVMSNGISARYQGKAYVSTFSRVDAFLHQFRWYRRSISFCPIVFRMRAFFIVFFYQKVQI